MVSPRSAACVRPDTDDQPPTACERMQDRSFQSEVARSIASVARSVLDAVEERLSMDRTFLERAAKAIRPLLAKTGTNTTSDNRQMYFCSFSVPVVEASGLRARTRKILEAALSSGAPALVHWTLKVLCEDVADPQMWVPFDDGTAFAQWMSHEQTVQGAEGTRPATARDRRLHRLREVLRRHAPAASQGPARHLGR